MINSNYFELVDRSEMKNSSRKFLAPTRDKIKSITFSIRFYSILFFPILFFSFLFFLLFFLFSFLSSMTENLFSPVVSLLDHFRVTPSSPPSSSLFISLYDFFIEKICSELESNDRAILAENSLALLTLLRSSSQSNSNLSPTFLEWRAKRE